MSRIGIITGLKSEIAAARQVLPGADYFAAGGSAARAEAGARRMVEAGAEVLVSLGVAGGLDPDLACGDIVLANAIVAPNHSVYFTDMEWCWRLRQRLVSEARMIDAPIFGADWPITSAEEKAELLRETGAAAVDMESHGVARAATALNIPLIVLRVVADPADRAIPALAIHGMTEEGDTRALPVLGRLLLSPWDLPALLTLAKESRAAHAVLGRVALRLSGVLG